ncbi:Nitrogen permease regulator 2 [Schaereria dolodes]|nr:Nitrogen permease regulator 2 [Schaereria dolodes]
MIKAIFFAKFDVHEGPKVVHQVPDNSIVSSSPTTNPALFHFPSISSYIIPQQSFCSHAISLSTSTYRILGQPICLSSPKYERNEYIFNFCLVLASSASASAYASVVNKVNTLFQHLEETSQFLSKDTSAPNTGKIHALCEILLEDLNNYCECMIPIDASNTLNIKLFPTYPPPPRILPHHVPLSTVRLSTLTDSNWDLTMLLILPYINGLNSVKQIALLADADHKLVRTAIAHLLYYGCILVLDIFQFGGIYAPTAEMATFVTDTDMQAECLKYVLLLPDTRLPGAAADNNAALASAGYGVDIDGTKLVEWYCSLRQGQPLKSWCVEHADVANVIDMRRFITFGVIKGFLYRVHKYAIATTATSPEATESGIGAAAAAAAASRRKRRSGKGSRKGKEVVLGPGQEDDELTKFLDGTHCFDEICTELMISEKELMGKLKAMGDVQIIHR